MATRFGEGVHVPMKDGSHRIFAAGDVVPVWARGRFGDHIATYDDSKVVREDEPDEALLAARKVADGLGVQYSDSDDADTVNAASKAEEQRREEAAKSGTDNADTSDDELRAKLAAIGQSTDGDHDALVARLNEHEG